MPSGNYHVLPTKNKELFTSSVLKYKLIAAAEIKKYKVTHTTGTEEGDEGDPGDNYFITLVGSTGEIAAHACRANRQKGRTGSCTIEDREELGELKTVRIKSIVANKWTVVEIGVEIEGLTGTWRHQGESVLEEKGTLTLDLQKNTGTS